MQQAGPPASGPLSYLPSEIETKVAKGSGRTSCVGRTGSA
jgi:hypothetical protein